MSGREKRILCAGEILYDFLSATPGVGLAGSTIFEKRPGGSPFNVAVGVARQGLPVGFLVKLGTDEFGMALRQLLQDEGIDPSYTLVGEGMNTTLAMAAIDADGKPEFRFYREDSAERSLRTDELPPLRAEDISIFATGSFILADDPAGATYASAFETLRTAGVTTLLDPNVRPLYVDARPVYRERLARLMPQADVLKLSDDDLAWITGTRDVEAGLATLPPNPGGLLILTEGPRGARAIWRGETIRAEAFAVEVAETTGCGDAFMAGTIAKLASLGDDPMKKIDPPFVAGLLRYACACAAIVATRRGAAESMPRTDEVEAFLEKR